MRTIRSFGLRRLRFRWTTRACAATSSKPNCRLADEGEARGEFIYCIPTHQNPAGCTLQLDRREKLLELARRFNTFVLEDDAYGELWFERRRHRRCSR